MNSRRQAVSLNKQRGFSLVTAIFVLVVLAAMGGFMISISGTQHFTTLHAFQGAKAYHAARSGMEWGIAAAGGASCPDGTTQSLTLGDFDVSVSCNEIGEFTEGGNPSYKIFRITSIAETGVPGNFNYAARQIVAVVTQ